MLQYSWLKGSFTLAKFAVQWFATAIVVVTKGCFKKGWVFSPCLLHMSSLLTLVVNISIFLNKKIVTWQLYKKDYIIIELDKLKFVQHFSSQLVRKWLFLFFNPSFTRTAKIGPIFVVRPKKIGKFLSFRPILCNWIQFCLFV